MTPQQYSEDQPAERAPPAERDPLGPEEGQRRSGGGNVHGALPVPGGTKEAGALTSPGLEFGWHHEAMSAIVPKFFWEDSVYFFCHFFLKEKVSLPKIFFARLSKFSTS